MPNHGAETAFKSRGMFVAPVAWTVAAWALAARAVAAFALAACLCQCEPAAADDSPDSLRVRIAWGGNQSQRWDGSVSLSAGYLCDPCPLGIEADEPGSMWLEDGRLLIRQKTPRLYDGLDIDVCPGSEDAVLRIELRADSGQQRAAQIDIPVRDLAAMVGERIYNTGLDEQGLDGQGLDGQGTRLLVRRVPGDTLRLKFERKSLVFSPGERFDFSVLPHRIPDLKGRELRIKIDVFADRGERHISSQKTDSEPLEPGAAVARSIDVPNAEGVYDLIISAEQIPSVRLGRVGSLPVGWKQTVARRKMQLVVIADKPPRRSSGQTDLKTVAEIDPANPKWWDRLAKSAEGLSRLKLPTIQAKFPTLQTFRKGPLGSGHRGTRKHPLGELVELAPGDKPGQATWEAYTLPIKNPGMPHVLEVEYPSDVPQTMGISVLEPDAAGALLPIQLDSGVDVVEELVRSGSAKPKMLRHRLIFWPRGNTPIVLITNRRSDRPAVYGRIRVLAGWKHLPKAFSAEFDVESGRQNEKQQTRLIAAYLDRPLFGENFSATEAYDAWSRRSLGDWRTFHEGATRMVEYLQHVGMDGLMLSVLADGGTIYPSRLLQPTPRYDKGVFFDSGQDPIRKDVLEMLLRLFDREGLRLIPALEFGAPLPELEARLRRGGPECVGIRWIGPDGQTWQDVYEPRRHKAPYYNVLHPHVQEAMLNVVRELLANYADHESVAGLALQLSGHGYAQLPGPDWGMDDATVAAFQRDTGIQLSAAGKSPSGTGRKRFMERWKQLTGPHRNEWLRWRAARLGRFYHRLQAEIVKAHPGARLYLAGADAFESEEAQEAMRPMLPRRSTMAEMLLRIGIDELHYRDPDGIVLLRPRRIAPSHSHTADAANLEIEHTPDRDAYFAGLPCTGSLFSHQPQELRLESFDQKSPFRSSFTLLSSQIVPSGSRNRRRFVHSLATLDTQVIFEGGWLMPLGQEDSTRPLMAAYRRLPAVKFKRLPGGTSPNSTQPVTIRQATHNGRTYLYAVNDSPLAATLKIRLKPRHGQPLTLEELSGQGDVPGLEQDAHGTYWQPTLEPYGLVAVRLSQADVAFAEPDVQITSGAEETLNARIRDLGARANALRAPPLLKVLDNSDFERPADATGNISGWITIKPHGTAVEFDRTQIGGATHKPRGIHCVRLRSNGPSVALISHPFKPPTTGRLKMFVWLCVPKAAKQPTLQWSLAGKLNGREFSRMAVVGQMATHPIGNEWGLYEFPVNSLPLDGLDELQVRFELQGPGEVLIDDVQLSHLEFEERELRELGRLIQTADLHLSKHQVSDCIRLLEGYWPRFLEANVPAPAAKPPHTVAANPRITSKPQREKIKKEKDPGWLDRVKDALPKRLW